VQNSPDGEFVPNAGSLYSFSADMDIKKHVDNITIANGLAWSADRTTMYYIDSPTKKVDAFRYDIATGNISEYFIFFGKVETIYLVLLGTVSGGYVDYCHACRCRCFGSIFIAKIDIDDVKQYHVDYSQDRRETLGLSEFC